MQNTGYFFGLEALAEDLPLVHARAIAEVLRGYRILVEPERIVRDYPDKSSKFIFETLVEKAGKRHCVPSTAELRAQKWTHMETLSADDIRLNPGTIIFVRRMHASSTPLGIVTGAPRRFAELVLRAGEVRPCFRIIVSVEDVGKSKREPAVYTHAAGQLHLPPEHCVTVERRESCMIGAKAAGMRCVALVNDPASVHVPVDWVVSDLRDWTPSAALAA